MDKHRNNTTQWIMILIILLGTVYNAVISRTILKNDVKHIAEDITEVKQQVTGLTTILLEHFMKD